MENKNEEKVNYSTLIQSGTMQEPFYITFNWEDTSFKVQLKNGEDVIKMGKLVADYLASNGIEVETTLKEDEKWKHWK